MSYPHLYIPETVLDVDPDSAVIEQIELKLKKLPFDPTMGVYTGVEGEDLIAGKALPHLTQTFGNDYEDFVDGAEKRDLFAINGLHYALTYARQACVPALVVYDKNELSPKDTKLWVPNRGTRLQDAVRAIIFFSGS